MSSSILTSYADEKAMQHKLVAFIVVSFCFYGVVQFAKIRDFIHFYIIGIFFFLLFLFGTDLTERAIHLRNNYFEQQQIKESFAEQRREKFRKHPEPWRPFITSSSASSSCPNVLIRKEDGKFYLYDTTLPDSVITNPKVFRTISEYIVYWKQQRAQGASECPIAYLQEDLSKDPTYYEVELEKELRDAMNMDRISKELRFYLPEGTQSDREPQPSEKKPFNLSSLGSVPLKSQEQGVWTERDEKALRSQIGGFPVSADKSATGVGVGLPGVSTNPMDPNWGGGYYSKILRDEGYFRHSFHN